MGAQPETFYGLTGIGDLIVTCLSEHSRNRRAGYLIGKGMTLEEAEKEVGMVVEGAYTVKAAKKLAQKYEVSMPIVDGAYDVLFNGGNIKDAIFGLMNREKKSE